MTQLVMQRDRKEVRTRITITDFDKMQAKIDRLGTSAAKYIEALIVEDLRKAVNLK